MEYPGGLVRPTTYAKSKLKLYLMIPPAQRTPSQIDEMANLIITLEIHFLKQYQNSHKLHALCGSIYLKPLPEKAVLFEQGDEGNALYCVFSGAVGIYSITKDEEGDQKQTMIAQIIPYEVIGEISILYGQKRTATAIATEDSELLVLDQEILTTILKGDDGMNHLEAHINALRGFALLQTCSDSYLKRIAAKCFTNKFRTYTVIIPQGQRPDGVYFIKSGKVKILRKIEFLTTAPLSYVENTELLRDPTRQEISDSKTEAKLIEIDELGPGEMFGELAVLSDRPITFTAVTSMPSELVLIEIKDIMGPQSEIKRRLREIVKSYPPDEYFRRIYYKNTLWNSYKKTLVNNVLVDKHARNQKGKLGLRSATPTPVKPRKNISFCHKQADLYSDKGAGVLKLPPIYNMYCMVDSKMNSGLSEDGTISTFSSFLKELTQKNQQKES